MLGSWSEAEAVLGGAAVGKKGLEVEKQRGAAEGAWSITDEEVQRETDGAG